MTIYILLNHVATIFLGLNVLTTLSFDSEVQSYLYGGGKDDIFIQLTSNQKTLALKSKVDGDLSNLLVVTKKRKYYFDLKNSKSNPHQFLEIRHGVANMSVKEIMKTKKFEIMEGKTSILVINKSKKDIDVNGIKVSTKEYFSKGVPIYLDGPRILN